jgi:S-adenosylmethionine uptake transporter
MNSWDKRGRIRQGILYGILLNCTSSINDVLARLLGDRLHFVEISFFRFLFSMITVLIVIILSDRNLFKSSIQIRHAVRGGLGAIALGLCCCSVNLMPLAESSTILFSDALFTPILALIFLGERPRLQSWGAIVIGFVGVIIMYRPSRDNLNIAAIIPTVASIIFAIMNIMIKQMVNIKEHILTMLFYFGLYTTVASCIFVPFYWISPNGQEVTLLFLLGCGANLIQIFGFLAFRATDTSNISPLRYTELLFSIFFGFVFFRQIPGFEMLIGAILIIVGAIISSSRAVSTRTV